MGRLILNLSRTIQLARFGERRERGDVWVNSTPVQMGLLPLEAIGSHSETAEAIGMGTGIAVPSVAHYRFIECSTNKITVLSYLTSHLKQATGLLKIFANTNLFFP